MIEVEAKIKISNPVPFRKAASMLGSYRGTERKIDEYYTLEKGHYPKKSLRVRRVKENYMVNFKSWLSYHNGIHSKKEVEFKVSDVRGFLDLIRDFGFRRWLVKEKISEIYEVRKNFHIEINNVKNLGWFIEVEYLTNNDKHEIDHAKREIDRILHALGVRKKQVISQGYTKMLWGKRH